MLYYNFKNFEFKLKVFLEKTFSKLLKCYTKSKRFLKRHIYNFESFKLILKISFEDTISIILNLS